MYLFFWYPSVNNQTQKDRFSSFFIPRGYSIYENALKLPFLLRHLAQSNTFKNFYAITSDFFDALFCLCTWPACSRCAG